MNRRSLIAALLLALIPALVHAPIENFIVGKLCKTTVTPNQLTIFCNVVAWGATILFATGNLGWGIARSRPSDFRISDIQFGRLDMCWASLAVVYDFSCGFQGR